MFQMNSVSVITDLISLQINRRWPFARQVDFETSVCYRTEKDIIK